MSANPRISLVNTYNEQGELIQAGNQRFVYDAAGNPLHRGGRYDPKTHALIEDAGAVFRHDTLGRLKHITHTLTPEEERFTWNALGQLIRYTRTKEDTTLEELTYTYDPLGRRASKTHTTQEATTTHRYLYDGENIVAILNEDNELLATILHHPDKTDTPLAITNHQTNQTYYYHRDHQGSIIALTSEEGQIVERITYDGHFGEIMEHTKHEITHNPYGYTGREMDTPRLYYYRARYYSPILHRFLSPDPIEHASGDYNWYRYVGNDPVNRVDPSGLDWVEKAADFFGAGPIDTYRAGTELAERAKKSAVDFAKKLYGNNKEKILASLNSGKADAYRHCVWSCLMTQTFGAEDAKTIGDNHEASGARAGQSVTDEYMDLHNNEIGRSCGKDKRPETCETKCKKNFQKLIVHQQY